MKNKKASATKKNINIKKEKYHNEKKINISKIRQFSKSTDKATKDILNQMPEIIKTAMPLSEKQIKALPKNIKSLFLNLTSERSNRRLNYLNNASTLSGYIHYYMQWNIFKLVKIFSAMDFSDIKDGDFLADFGSGPLTLICALWIAKPELRKKKLTWYCIDNAGKALTAGKDIFLTLCAHTQLTSKEETPPWHIIKVTGSFGIPLKNKIALYTSANLFNEFFSHSRKTIFEEGKKIAKTINQYLNENGNILIIEPGTPLGGEIISALRTILLANNYQPTAPCTHNKTCPMPVSKNTHTESKNYDTKHQKTDSNCITLKKWCHFTIETNDAPQHLLNFSKSINLPKKTVPVSFLYCKNKHLKHEKNHTHSERIISETINLPENKIGRYCCGKKGFSLLRARSNNSILRNTCSGDILQITQTSDSKKNIDKKSGATIIDIE